MLLLKRNILYLKCLIKFQYANLCLVSQYKLQRISISSVNTINKRAPYRTTTEEDTFYSNTENDHFYQILLSNKSYVKTLAYLDDISKLCSSKDLDFILNCNYNDKSAYSLIEYLKIYVKAMETQSELLNNKNFFKFCDVFMSKLKELPIENILYSLRVLTLWPLNLRNTLFFEICREIDEHLLKLYRDRDKAWSRSKIIYIMDHFYRLKVVRYSHFMWDAMKIIWRNPESLSPKQFVHSMFLINANRKWHPSVDMTVVQYALDQNLSELNIEEIAIVALAFFKSETKIFRPELLEKIYDRVELSLDILHPITLTAYLKFFRYTTPYFMHQRLLHVLDRLVDRIDEVSLQCCVHMAQLGTNILVRHSESLKRIAYRLTKDLSQARIKDIERIILALLMFDIEFYEKPNIFEITLNELNTRKNEMYKYPRPFVCAVNYIALKGYYNFDLSNIILSNEFLKKIHKKVNIYTIPRDILQLSNGLRIDCPDYCGNLLNTNLEFDMYQNSCKFHNPDYKALTTYETLMYEAKSVYEKILGGSSFIHYTYTLPHFPRPDLLFCLKDGKPVSLGEEKKFLPIKPVPNDNDWYVVIYMGLNTTVYGTYEPQGKTKAKVRQLKKLGYKPIFFKQLIWIKLNDAQRLDYLKNLTCTYQKENNDDIMLETKSEKNQL